MESIREIKDNPELAKELAEALLPYILQSEEFKLMRELREKIDALIENTNKLWQAINKNSEDIRVMQEEIKLIHEDNKRLWEAVNKNSEDIRVMQAALNKNSEEIRLIHEDNRRIWETIREMNTTLVRIDSTLGAFTGRAGVYFEKTVFEIYREALRLHGVDPSRVRRKNIVDDTGVIQKGRRYQVDLIEEDGETYLFEVKNYADNGALEQLDIRRKILEAKGRKVKPFLVANMVEERTKNQAEKQGVTVIAGRIVETPEDEDEAKTGEN